jgi:hypothetical protein
MSSLPDKVGLLRCRSGATLYRRPQSQEGLGRQLTTLRRGPGSLDELGGGTGGAGDALCDKPPQALFFLDELPHLR